MVTPFWDFACSGSSAKEVTVKKLNGKANIVEIQVYGEAVKSYVGVHVLLKLLIAAVNPGQFVKDPRVAKSLRAVIARVLSIAEKHITLLYLRLTGSSRRLLAESSKGGVASFEVRDDMVRATAMKMSAEPVSSIEMLVDTQLRQVGVQGSVGVEAVDATPVTFGRYDNGTVVLEPLPDLAGASSSTTLDIVEEITTTTMTKKEESNAAPPAWVGTTTPETKVDDAAIPSKAPERLALSSLAVAFMLFRSH